ncbi:hypothetical protein QJS04_geneDACA023906 [Acorus gramineus]|uniref:Ribosome biogenesis protein slx9-like n=1 Tax=Acorus gramineus TaxID=55184 RepID=A0AAV9ALX6_ACOGR|nr:hypothetical protein QJS04_geneDACA023906 [Acorus gramineus]
MGLTGLRSRSEDKELFGSTKRKFDKKLGFYAKVRDTVVALATKKAITKKSKLRSRHKKVKAYDLSSLSEFLPSLDALQKPPHPTEFKLNSKSRKKLVVKEARQLKAVLNNETFKLDSLAAIHQHLQMTQPVKEVSRQKRTVKTAKKKRTTKSSAAQSMEF